MPSDPDFEARVSDPSLIASHEEVIAIIEDLDGSIAHIQMQIEACAVEANGREMPPERQAWLRRASYAAAIQRGQRHRIMQRDRELRGGAQPRPAKEPGEGIAKQERLKVEAEARQAAAEARRLDAAVRLREAEERASWRRRFVVEARRMLEAEMFAAIEAAARGAE